MKASATSAWLGRQNFLPFPFALVEAVVPWHETFTTGKSLLKLCSVLRVFSSAIWQK